MRFMLKTFAILSLTCSLGLSGCSGGKGPGEAKSEEKTVSEQAAQSIREYAQKPMDRARATQQLGDERTEAIDRALKQ